MNPQGHDQRSLFEAGTEAAQDRRDRGMARAVDHADRVEPKWSSKAEAYVVRVLDEWGPHRRFLAEELVAKAEREGVLSDPPDRRAWGAVIVRLAKRGVIEHCGFARARTSNQGPKSVWQKRAA